MERFYIGISECKKRRVIVDNYEGRIIDSTPKACMNKADYSIEYKSVYVYNYNGLESNETKVEHLFSLDKPEKEKERIVRYKAQDKRLHALKIEHQTYLRYCLFAEYNRWYLGEVLPENARRSSYYAQLNKRPIAERTFPLAIWAYHDTILSNWDYIGTPKSWWIADGEPNICPLCGGKSSRSVPIVFRRGVANDHHCKICRVSWISDEQGRLGRYAKQKKLRVLLYE